MALSPEPTEVHLGFAASLVHNTAPLVGLVTAHDHSGGGLRASGEHRGQARPDVLGGRQLVS